MNGKRATGPAAEAGRGITSWHDRQATCCLAGYQMPFTQDQLRKLYASRSGYQDRVRRRLDELEKGGWSLPVYRDAILADAAAVAF